MRVPVKHGDTIHVESTVIAARASESRPDTGVVTFARRFVNQHGAAVQEMEITILYRKRPG
jgi:acyl dehydratase